MTTSNLKRPPAKPLPTLLTKADALLFAAEQMDLQISNLELASIFAEAFNKPRDKEETEEGKAAIAEIRTLCGGIVDKDIQIAAMREAAKEMRALAGEIKLADARAANRGLSVSA